MRVYFRLLTIRALRAAEAAFLRAHGWTEVNSANETWTPPIDLPLKHKHDVYHRVHAINAQRAVYANLTRGRTGE
jgi:hypothetical protein